MNDDFIETLPGIQWGDHSRSSRKARAFAMHSFQGSAPGRGRTTSYDDHMLGANMTTDECANGNDDDGIDDDFYAAADDDILDYAPVDGLDQTYVDVLTRESDDSLELNFGAESEDPSANILVPTTLADEFEGDEMTLSTSDSYANNRKSARKGSAEVSSGQSSPHSGDLHSKFTPDGELQPLIRKSEAVAPTDPSLIPECSSYPFSRTSNPLQVQAKYQLRSQNTVISYESFKDVIRNKGAITSTTNALGRRTSRARTLSNCEVTSATISNTNGGEPLGETPLLPPIDQSISYQALDDDENDGGDDTRGIFGT